MTAIQTTRLTRHFQGHAAVDAIDLTVREEEFFALLGSNGAGKTTTIKMLCCLLLPTSGDAHLQGHSITTQSQDVKRIINLSPQETAVAPNLTVQENLEFIAGIYGDPPAEAQRRAAEMMHTFSLADRAASRARTLSGGMQRRLSIAMAMITQPHILFLDEPTLGLDVRAKRDLWHTLKGLKGKTTLVLTTHDLNEAEALCEQICIMHAGKVRAQGTAARLKELTGQLTLEEAFLALTGAEVAA